MHVRREINDDLLCCVNTSRKRVVYTILRCGNSTARGLRGGDFCFFPYYIAYLVVETYTRTQTPVHILLGTTTSSSPTTQSRFVLPRQCTKSHFFFFLMLFKRENNRVQLLAGVRKLSLHCWCAREQSNERQALPAPRWTNVSVKYASIKWICRSAGSRKGTDGAVRCNKIVAAGLSTRECGPYRTDAGTNSCAARAQSPFWLHPLDASGRTPRNQGEILPTKVSYTGDAHT